MRLSGFVRWLIGTLSTDSVSAGSTTRSGCGACQYANTGFTAKPVREMSIESSTRTGVTVSRFRPVSSSASRSAVSISSTSSGSTRPPGKAIWPACLRRVVALCVSTTLASSGRWCASASPLISTNTADRAGFRNGFSCVEESRRNFANARFTLDDEAERPATCCSEWPVVAWLALLA